MYKPKLLTNKKAMQSQTLSRDATTKVNEQPAATPPPKIT